MFILPPLYCDRVNENLDVTTMTYYLRQCNIHDSYLGPRQFLFNAILRGPKILQELPREHVTIYMAVGCG